MTNQSDEWTLLYSGFLEPVLNNDTVGNVSILTVQIPCACTRDITIQDLTKIGGHASTPIMQALVAPMNEMFAKYGIISCLEKAHFLAQVAVESSWFTVTAEGGVSAAEEQSNYGGYKGRGLLQLTFQAKYASYGSYVGQNFLTPQTKILIEQPHYACDSAGWFWTIGNGHNVNLNDLAKNNDIISISNLINGGFNGYKGRVEAFKRALKQLNVLHCEVLPQSVISDVETTKPFNQSLIYTGTNNAKRGSCFAWGYWHDPLHPHTSHVAVDADLSKEGYQRYLDLTATHPLTSARFGLGTVANMNQIAHTGAGQ